jgi:hypothetical protein
MEKNTLVLIEIINGQNLSLGPIKDETMPLDVTIDSHTKGCLQCHFISKNSYHHWIVLAYST